MIVLFQMILCTGKQLLQYIVTKIYSSYFPCDIHDDPANRVKCIYEGEPACYDSDRGLRFSPPLYSQRYLAVQDLIKDERWFGHIHKIVDFGCAELKFFKFSKNIKGVREVLEVDIQSSTLECNIYRVQPLISDFIQRRSEALDVSVLAGSIKDPDPRLINTDMVVAIEIIEHLYPDTLEAVPYNIFKFIKPCVAVFTTPNADFNVLFPSLNQFRHDDHKFEWTREQFQDWANNIVARFPEYTVSFHGIGALPSGILDNLGCCTQMAVFYNANYKSHVLADDDDYTSCGICTYKSYTAANDYPMYVDEKYTRPCYYKLITEVNFPYEEIDETTQNDKILHEVVYRLSIYGAEYGLYFNYTKWRSEVPIAFLHTFVRDMCTLDEFIMILKEHYLIENRLIDDTIQMCVIYEIKDTTPESSSICSEELENHSLNNRLIIDGDGDADATDSDWETIQYSTPKHSDRSLAISRDEHNTIVEEDVVPSAEIAVNCHLSEEDAAHKTNGVNIPVDNSVIDKIKLKNEITLYVPKATQSLNTLSDVVDAPHEDVCAANENKAPLSTITENGTLTSERISKSENVVHPRGDKNYKLFKTNSKHIEINVKLNSKSGISCHKLNDLKIKTFPMVAAAVQPELKPPAPPVNLEPPRVVENGDLINNNRDGEGNNYEAAGSDEERFENNLEDWNFDQHNENHIVRDDVEPIAEKDHAAEDVIEHVVHGKVAGDDLVKDLSELVAEKINYQIYQVNDCSISPTFDKSKYSVYFRTDPDMYREAPGHSSSSLEVNTSNVDVDELSLNSDIPSVVGVGSGLSENLLRRETVLMPEPFPEWLMRLMPVVNLENHEDLDYLSQGDNLTVNPNDDDFEESSSTETSHDNEDADDEDDGVVDALDVEDSESGLVVDELDSTVLIGGSEAEEYFFDSLNDLPSDELQAVGSRVEPALGESKDVHQPT